MTPQQEKFLLFRIRHFQDESAFRTLVDEFGSRIQKFLRARLPNTTEADDAYSETWMDLWTYAQSTEIQNFSAVAFTIARNTVAGYYKTREKRPEFAVDEEIMETYSSNLHQTTIDQIDVNILKEVIAELKEEAAQILLLRYVEGFSVKDIAKQFGKTENATSVIIHRSIHKVREIIKKRFGDV